MLSKGMSSTNPLLAKVILFTRKTLITVGIFSLFSNILMLTIPLYMMQLFDRVVTTYSYETLIYLTIAAIIALVVLSALEFIRSRIILLLSYWQNKVLGPEVLGRCPDELLVGGTYGPQSLRDIETIRQFLGGASVFALFDAPWVPVYLFVVFLLHPALGLVALFFAILLFVLAIMNEKVTHLPSKNANIHSSQAQQFADAALRHAEVIQAMGMMPALLKHWTDKNDKALQSQMEVSEVNTVYVTATKFSRMVMQVAMLSVGAYFVLQNSITAGAMMAGSILASRALAPVEQMVGMWRQLQNVIEVYKRLKLHLEKETVRGAGIQLPVPIGEIAIENVSYAVPTMKNQILSNVSFKIRPGELIALIGPSSAGKSTLARLMVGAFKPTAGNVRLDGADVYTWDREDFGKYIGYLPQDVELFAGTVKDNIARLGDVDDEEVIKAAKLAGLHDVILHLQQGYNTPIVQGGYGLSGGLRQRIALARALYKQPKVIVLDEPNSNLDAEGELALQQAIAAMREMGSTQIIVSHKTNILKYVDSIVLLVNGQVQMAGPRDQVLAKLQSTVKPAATTTGVSNEKNDSK